MCSPKSSPYWKSNSSWPDFSTGIERTRPSSFARFGMSEPNCSSTSTPVAAASTPRSHRELHPLEDQPLRVGDPLGLLRGGIALDPEHLLLERPAVVEGQDVQLSVVAERHRIDLLGVAFSLWLEYARPAREVVLRATFARRVDSCRSMASGPDLFVVCKSCGSEVSPYITECPYCGTRLRKRAPKLERGGTPKPPKRSRPRLAPLRRGEIPGHPARPPALRHDPHRPRLDRRHARGLDRAEPGRRRHAERARALDRRRRGASSRSAGRSTASGGSCGRPSSSTARPATRSPRWPRSRCSGRCSSGATAGGRR